MAVNRFYPAQCYINLGGINYGRKTMGQQNRLSACNCGCSHRSGQPLEIPVSDGRKRRFTFLVVYLIFVLILGLPCMMLEMSLGRYTGRDPIQSYKMVNPKAKIVGIFGVLAPFIILSYYSVIGGWLIKYVVSYATTFNAPADFGTFIASPTTVIWHFIFMAMVIYVCYKGYAELKSKQNHASGSFCASYYNHFPFGFTQRFYGRNQVYICSEEGLFPCER